MGFEEWANRRFSDISWSHEEQQLYRNSAFSWNSCRILYPKFWGNPVFLFYLVTHFKIRLTSLLISSSFISNINAYGRLSLDLIYVKGSVTLLWRCLNKTQVGVLCLALNSSTPLIKTAATNESFNSPWNFRLSGIQFARNFFMSW